MGEIDRTNLLALKSSEYEFDAKSGTADVQPFNGGSIHSEKACDIRYLIRSSRFETHVPLPKSVSLLRSHLRRKEKKKIG